MRACQPATPAAAAGRGGRPAEAGFRWCMALRSIGQAHRSTRRPALGRQRRGCKPCAARDVAVGQPACDGALRAMRRAVRAPSRSSTPSARKEPARTTPESAGGVDDEHLGGRSAAAEATPGSQEQPPAAPAEPRRGPTSATAASAEVAPGLQLAERRRRRRGWITWKAVGPAGRRTPSRRGWRHRPPVRPGAARPARSASRARTPIRTTIRPYPASVA